MSSETTPSQENQQDNLIPTHHNLCAEPLVANAYKHAFPANQHGAIEISLAVIGEGKARLAVSDNGIGMPAAPLPVTIGQQIIAELVDQLGGEMTMDQNQGTHVAVTFPCPPELPC